MTEFILRIFRVNGALLVAGDRLVGDLGLTSARWQLLGGVAREEVPLSVAQLARQMGVTRQAVQRITNELEAAGILSFHPNPRHKRAQLVQLTAHGRALFERAMRLQRPWSTRLADGLSASEVAQACGTIDRLLTALGETAMGNSEPVAIFNDPLASV